MSVRAIVAVLIPALVLCATGCAAKKKSAAAAEVVTAEATLVQVDAAMARRQMRKAKILLQKIQFTQTERPTYEPLVRLALADATYYLGDDLSLIEARSTKARSEGFFEAMAGKWHLRPKMVST